MIVLCNLEQLLANDKQLSTTFILTSLSIPLKHCFNALSGAETYDPSCHGYIVIIEPDDDIKAVETETGCPIFSDWFGESQYGDADYTPSYDHLEAHLLFYELGFITNDEGYTVLIIVPKLTGIDTSLLKLCREYAQPGSS